MRELKAARARDGAAVKPGDVQARLLVIGSEAAADDDLAVRLEIKRGNETVRPGAEVDAGVGRAIRHDAGDAVAADSVEMIEVTDDHDAAIDLQRERIDCVVPADVGAKEGRIE